MRDRYNKNIAKGSALITPKGRTSGRFSFSTVVTPECLQELTQTPRGLSPLVEFMTTRLANNPDFNSNGETDDETTIFSPEDETSDEEISPKTDFKKEFGRSADKKKTEPYVT